MNIRLDNGEWIVEHDYYITESLKGYEVYGIGEDTEQAQSLYSSESFEECLTWIWNSL